MSDLHSTPLTTWIAVYAAVLSTAVAVNNFYLSRPRLKVDLTPGINNEGEAGVFVGLANPSAHTIHVNTLSLLYKWKRPTLKESMRDTWRFKRINFQRGWCHTSLVFDGLNTGLPVSIPPYSSHLVFVGQDRVKKMLAEAVGPFIIACAQDALWRNKYSKPFNTTWI